MYKLNCSRKKYYTGETKQNVSTRIKEHKQDIQKKADKVMSRNILNNPSHKINIDHFHLSDSENNGQKRTFSEMFFIEKYKNKMINLKINKNNLYLKCSQVIGLQNERFQRHNQFPNLLLCTQTYLCLLQIACLISENGAQYNV